MKSYRTKKNEVRNMAIEWQYDMYNHDYSYGEVAAFQSMFYGLAKRFGLVREFRENAVI